MSIVSLIFFLNVIFTVTFFLTKNFYFSIFFTGLIIFGLNRFYAKNFHYVNKFLNKFGEKTFLNPKNKDGYLKVIVSTLTFLVASLFIDSSFSIVIAVVIFSVLFKKDSRFFFSMAIFFLVLTIFLSLRNYSLFELSFPAKSAAVTAYFFLIIGTLWQLVEITLRRHQ